MNLHQQINILNMNNKQFLENVLEQRPEFMRRLSIANDVTLTECFNSIQKNKAVINFHLCSFNFQRKDLFDPVILAAALIDTKQYLEIMLDKLNELNKF